MKIKPRMDKKPNPNFVPPSSVHRDGGVSMSDRENLKAIIDGLRCAAGDPMPCAKCRYSVYLYNLCKCKCKCAEDALELLKAQEPRVLTLEDLRNIGSVWELNTPPYLCMDINPSYRRIMGSWVAWRNIYELINGLHPTYNADNYGKTWRCWSAKPTEEERKAVKWDG